MATAVGSIGARVDLTVRAGDTLGPIAITLKDESGAPLNLLGASFEAAVSKLDTDDGNVALTVTVVDAASGEVSVSLADTEDMDAESDFFVASSAYSWYFKMTDSQGVKQTVLYGMVKVAKKEPS